MSKSRLPKSLRKFLRREKARLRRAAESEPRFAGEASPPGREFGAEAESKIAELVLKIRPRRGI